MNENQKYEVIKKLVETNGNKDRAALNLNCSRRTIDRMIQGYLKNGKEFFVHGNRGRKPAHTLSEEFKLKIVKLYQEKYYDCNFTHFKQLLLERESIEVSESVIRKILRGIYIISPKANRSTRKELKDELKQAKKQAKTKKEVKNIDTAILGLEEAHPRRPRATYAGELVQMDASIHIWFGDSKTTLHIAVDDATGAIVGAWFDKEETLNGYYHVFAQILTDYGIPYEFFTDKRTVFEYTKKQDSSVEKDIFTQFSYACNQLGVSIKTSSIPQAKGRVERMFNTLQSRLIVELRLSNTQTIDQANEFLNSYIKKFNEQFALPFDNIKSVFEMQPENEKINLLLAVLSTRKIDNGCCLKYNNDYYLPVDAQGIPTHYRKGTSALVIKALDENLYCSIGEEIYALQLLPEHKPSSKTFDLVDPKEKPKKKYIPPMSHPWKQESFNKFVSKQEHRKKAI